MYVLISYYCFSSKNNTGYIVSYGLQIVLYNFGANVLIELHVPSLITHGYILELLLDCVMAVLHI